MVDFVRSIAIGSDHAGYELKMAIKQYLIRKGYKVEDFGSHSEESVDYPDYAHPLAEEISNKSEITGILICGSGIGVSITANKHRNVRAALCWNTEIAALSRKHNDANILCLPARFLNDETAFLITETFLNTEFEGGRHAKRIEKISKVQ